jgi:hypothetical protein
MTTPNSTHGDTLAARQFLIRVVFLVGGFIKVQHLPEALHHQAFQ